MDISKYMTTRRPQLSQDYFAAATEVKIATKTKSVNHSLNPVPHQKAVALHHDINKNISQGPRDLTTQPPGFNNTARLDST